MYFFTRLWKNENKKSFCSKVYKQKEEKLNASNW